jgi:hypothetical protein
MTRESRVASLVASFIIAGFLLPLLGTATVSLAAGIQPLLVSAGGFSDELLAYRVAFTLIRLPLTAFLGVLVAAAQNAIVPDVQPLARRWLMAAAIGGLVSALILLPSSLVLIAITGNASPEMLRLFLALAGAALFGGFVSFFQRWTARRKLDLPGWFVAAGVLGTTAGALAEHLSFIVTGGLR